MICRITLFAVISSQTFCTAVTFSSLTVTEGGLSFALTLLTGAPVHWITPISGLTFITIFAHCQVVAWLFALYIVWTGTVTVT